jgi:hypothetical protein
MGSAPLAENELSRAEKRALVRSAPRPRTHYAAAIERARMDPAELDELLRGEDGEGEHRPR